MKKIIRKVLEGHTLLMILMVKKLLESDMKKNCKKNKSKQFRVGKVIKNVINYMLNGKASIILFNNWIDKKT